MLENARKLLEIYAARLDSARTFLENELLENARLDFTFPTRRALKPMFAFIKIIL